MMYIVRTMFSSARDVSSTNGFGAEGATVTAVVSALAGCSTSPLTVAAAATSEVRSASPFGASSDVLLSTAEPTSTSIGSILASASTFAPPSAIPALPSFKGGSTSIELPSAVGNEEAVASGAAAVMGSSGVKIGTVVVTVPSAPLALAEGTQRVAPYKGNMLSSTAYSLKQLGQKSFTCL